MSSYSEDTGKYQKEFDILIKKIPDHGESFDTRIELIRIACNLNHEMFNNGMQNCTEDGSRRSDYDFLASKIEMGFVDDFMKSLQYDEDNDIDYVDRESEKIYKKACDEFNKVIDRVIEKIVSTGFFKEVQN